MAEVAVYDEASLAPFRDRCDPLADGVIEALVAGGDLAAAGRLMTSLVRHDGVPDGALPGPVQDYLEATSSLPPWADPARLRRGAEVFAEHGPLCVLALFHASLPICYSCGDGVQVLAMTARLETDVTRRIAETAQFVLDVMDPDGLAPGGAGLRDAQKVRLMHAAVRHLLRASGRWDPAWKQPVNQLDLALTLQTFSVVVLDALARLGVELEADEEDAFVHTWRVVGHVLGVDPALSPEEPAAARALLAAGLGFLTRASPEGRAMEAALQDMLRHVMPGNAFDDVVPALTRHLIGDARRPAGGGAGGLDEAAARAAAPARVRAGRARRSRAAGGAGRRRDDDADARRDRLDRARRRAGAVRDPDRAGRPLGHGATRRRSQRVLKLAARSAARRRCTTEGCVPSRPGSPG